MIEKIRALLAQSSGEDRRQIFEELKETVPRHAFERRMNASAEVIIAALDRANDISLRGIRGLIGEATFVLEIAPLLAGWVNVTPPGDLPYDAALKDAVSTVKVQVKMQRREKGIAWLRKGAAVVEVQRNTRWKAKRKSHPPIIVRRIRLIGGLYGAVARSLEFFPLHSRTVAISSGWRCGPDSDHAARGVGTRRDLDERFQRSRPPTPLGSASTERTDIGLLRQAEK